MWYYSREPSFYTHLEQSCIYIQGTGRAPTGHSKALSGSPVHTVAGSGQHAKAEAEGKVEGGDGESERARGRWPPAGAGVGAGGGEGAGVCAGVREGER